MTDKPIFNLYPDPSKKDVLSAIYQVEHAAWEKGGKPAGQEPTVQQVQAAYGLEGNVEKVLMLYATKGKNTLVPTFGSDQQMSKDDAARLGEALLKIEDIIVERNKTLPALQKQAVPRAACPLTDGNSKYLELKELSAYLQSVKQSGAFIFTLESASQWADANNIGLTNHASFNGIFTHSGKPDLDYQSIKLETRPGQKRVVGNGIITKPLDGYYGGISSSYVGDGDLLDVYLDKDYFKREASGQNNPRKIFVMQQMADGKPDELKLGFTESLDQFRAIQLSTWEKPEKFKKANEGKYAELNEDQFIKLKATIQKNPSITLDEFIAQEKLVGVERVPTGVAAPAPTVITTATPPITPPTTAANADTNKSAVGQPSTGATATQTNLATAGAAAATIAGAGATSTVGGNGTTKQEPTQNPAPAKTAPTTATITAHDDDALIEYALGKGKPLHGNLFKGDHRLDKSFKATNRILQESLNLANAGVLKTDGQFGEKTTAAVEKFQTEQSLTKDGIAGFQTITALQVAEVQAQLKTLGTAPISEADKLSLREELSDVVYMMKSDKGKTLSDANKKNIAGLLDALTAHAEITETDAILGKSVAYLKTQTANKGK